ncbi:hypothetical protein [Chitinimonas koreensis]|uniref:hypothetical protein n=1 Tax=Chitinimonas koreensis TaxID=356302 RepID=UPI00041A1F0A|nr:hypothetical protein [Chitinimonas koreensis]QNM98135.1 hypothetical protein H9L41_07760 [Chitinimonas koreensis]
MSSLPARRPHRLAAQLLLAAWAVLSLAAGTPAASGGAAAQPVPAAAANAIVIVAPSDVIADYQLLLGERMPEQVGDYGGPYSRRDTVELLLTWQALRAAGYRGPIEMIPADSYERILAELQIGHADIGGTTAWLDDLAGKPLDVSDPLIEDGQFEAGLFTLPTNRAALASTTPAAVRKLRAVSNRAWSADWAVLTELGVRRLENVPVWPSMVRMVAAGRVDFLLAPFQGTPDGSLFSEDIRLVPIPGVKLALPGSRHLPISRSSAGHRQAGELLNRGLAVLRRQGLLRRAYEESGFIQRRTADWRLLNPR